MSYSKQFAGKSLAEMWPEDRLFVSSFLQDAAEAVRTCRDEAYYQQAHAFLDLLEQKYTQGFHDHPVLVAYLTAWRFYLDDDDKQLYPDEIAKIAQGIVADPDNPHFDYYAKDYVDALKRRSKVDVKLQPGDPEFVERRI